MNNILSFIHETSFLIPIIVLLGVSILFTVLTVILKLKFLPTFVIEIIIGIVLRQIFYNQTFNETYYNITEIMYVVGFVLIMFISGFDNNISLVNKDKQKTSNNHINIKNLSLIFVSLFYVISLCFSLFFFKDYENKISGIILLTVTISSTFAGLVVPLVKEEGLSKTILGSFITYLATISELISIVLLTIFMVVINFSVVRLVAYLGLILLFVIAWLLNKVIKKSTEQIEKGFTYFPFRILIVILGACVVLCEYAGGEYVLGAFLLGMVLKKINFSEEVVEKIESICFGIFAPIFFVIVGTKLDIRIFIDNPQWLLTVLIMVVAFISCKLPLIYLKRWYNKKATTLTVSLSACTLIVGLAVSHLGDAHGIFSKEFGECIILASIITCVLTSIVCEIISIKSLNEINLKETNELISYGREEIE